MEWLSSLVSDHEIRTIEFPACYAVTRLYAHFDNFHTPKTTLCQQGLTKSDRKTTSLNLKQTFRTGWNQNPFLVILKFVCIWTPALASGVRILWDSPPGMSTLKTMIWTGAPVPRESGPIVNWCDAYIWILKLRKMLLDDGSAESRICRSQTNFHFCSLFGFWPFFGVFLEFGKFLKTFFLDFFLSFFGFAEIS